MRVSLVFCIAALCVAGCSSSPSAPDEDVTDALLLLEDAWFPSWSPDGTGVICNRTPPGPGNCVWWVSADGEESDTLIVDADDPLFPKWMPDGRHIAYYRSREDGKDSVHEFVVHDLDGGDPVVREVPSLCANELFTVVPDGSELLYTVTSGSSGQIWAVDLSDGSMRFVRDGRSGVVSPDGEWIAFVKMEYDVRFVAVAPSSGGAEVVSERGSFPAWTPDSEYIVFSGFRPSNDPDLVIMSRDGSYREFLTDDPELDFAPAVAPQGDRLAYGKTPTDQYGPFNIRLLELSTSALGHRGVVEAIGGGQ